MTIERRRPVDLTSWKWFQIHWDKLVGLTMMLVMDWRMSSGSSELGSGILVLGYTNNAVYLSTVNLGSSTCQTNLNCQHDNVKLELSSSTSCTKMRYKAKLPFAQVGWEMHIKCMHQSCNQSHNQLLRYAQKWEHVKIIMGIYGLYKHVIHLIRKHL